MAIKKKNEPTFNLSEDNIWAVYNFVIAWKEGRYGIMDIETCANYYLRRNLEQIEKEKHQKDDNRTCLNCKFQFDYPKCFKEDNKVCADFEEQK